MILAELATILLDALIGFVGDVRIQVILTTTLFLAYWNFVWIRIRLHRLSRRNIAFGGFYLEMRFSIILGSIMPYSIIPYDIPSKVIFDRRAFYEIPFYLENYRLRWGSSVDKFHLTKLPAAALKQILQTMQPAEQILLSMASKKAAEVIQKESLKLRDCNVFIQDEYSMVTMNKGSFTMSCGNAWHEPQIGIKLVYKNLPQWAKPPLSSLQNTASVLNHLLSLYPKLSLNTLSIDFNRIQTISVEQILSVPIFRKWEQITIKGKKIEARDLDLIMDLATSKRKIFIEKALIPVNYSHENAFKFGKIEYRDARWVKLENLFSLRNSLSVHLRRCRLHYSDVNLFIKYWMHCDEDMVRELNLYIFEPSALADIFKDLSVMKAVRKGKDYYLIASEPTETKKFNLLVVSYFVNTIILRFYEPNLAGLRMTIPWTREYEVLKILTEKEDLEKHLKELEEGRREARAEIIEELKEMIKTLTEKLNTYPIYYEVDGMVAVEDIND